MAVSTDRLRPYYNRSTADGLDTLANPIDWVDDVDFDPAFQDAEIDTYEEEHLDDTPEDTVLQQPTLLPKSKVRLREKLTNTEWNDRFPPRQTLPRKAKIQAIKHHNRNFDESQQAFVYAPTHRSANKTTWKVSVAQLLHEKHVRDLNYERVLNIASPTKIDVVRNDSTVSMLCTLSQSFFDKNFEQYKNPQNLPYHRSSTIQKECAHLFKPVL